MKNEKGGMLALAIIYLLVCTIIGYGLMRLSLADQIEVINAARSTQAFWLAEAGIEKAIADLPTIHDDVVNPRLVGTLGAGRYTAVSAHVPGYSFRWEITSDGDVLASDGSVLEKRRIRVEITPVGNVLTTKGPINDYEKEGNVLITGPVESNATFSFEEVTGHEKEYLRNSAEHDYVDPQNAGDLADGVSSTTWITLTDPNDTLVISNTNWSGSGLLVVEGNLRITGGTFSGILWVTGSLEMSTGNVVINGSVFVECDTTTETTLHGTPTLTYDAKAIDDVYKHLETCPPSRKTATWREIPT